MQRLLFFGLAAFMALLAGSCHHSDSMLNEASFYGSWKGNPAWDTLVFSRQGSKNILRYNNSFNPQVPVYTETEFAYRNDKLYIGNSYSMTAMVNLAPFEGFAWVTPGKSFKVQVNQIYSFLSAYPANSTYTKIE